MKKRTKAPKRAKKHSVIKNLSARSASAVKGGTLASRDTVAGDLKSTVKF